MEQLKKSRSIARRQFSKAKKELIAAMEVLNPEDLQGQFVFVTEKAEILFGVEERIKEQQLNSENITEEDILKDCETADEYKKDWINLKVKYEKLIKSNTENIKYDSASLSSISLAKRKLHLPKLEIQKFDGNAKNWLGFWGMFKKIHTDDTIDNDDKFAYLLQSMSIDSPARALVESFPHSGDNYFEAVEQLKARYARDELLIEIYVRELLELVLQQSKGEDIVTSALYDKLKTQLRALECLGVTTDKYAAMLYPLVESALPTELLRVWERQRSRDKDIDILKGLLDFVKTEVESEERIKLNRKGLASTSFNEISTLKLPTASCLISSITKPSQAKQFCCIWCDKNTHTSLECYKAQKMSLKNKQEVISKKKACTVCLKIGHIGKRCKSFIKCLVCQKRHAILLCPEVGIKDEMKNSNTNPGPSTSDNSELAMLERSNKTTMLPSLIVKIRDTSIRAFIDTGAQRSYILESVATRLKLRPTRQEILRHCLFGAVETQEEVHKIYDLIVYSNNKNFSITMSVLSKNKICGTVPRINMNSTIMSKLKQQNILISDIGEGTPDIEMLIGADYAGMIMIGPTIHIESNIYAINTKLGWTLQGTVNDNSKSVLMNNDKVDITYLWNLEVLGIEDPKITFDRKETETEVMNLFKENISLNNENRYEVSLPWKIDRPEILENRELAERRLKSTTKRLESLNELNNYSEVFKEWLGLGIIEEDPDTSSKGHYLPHHAVIKNSSVTTRVRPVFDASAKDINGNSINSCLEKGQNFLELIPIMLTRFRMHAIGITSDIKKAFLQISLQEDDRRFLRFLWWKDIEKQELIVYRHSRVVFGLTCSPFLLGATIIYHLDQFADKYVGTAQKLKESLYVDNCVMSLETQKETEIFIKNAKNVMNEGKFDLRGWITAPIKCDGSEEQASISVLGMIWDAVNDFLYCNINPIKESEKLTKRDLLSVTHKIFDPIGIACPTTLIPKLLLQKSWSINTSWDKNLPDDICKEYYTWAKDIHLLKECKIPRRLTSKPINQCRRSLHIFSDASMKAYATCIFLRTESEDKEVTVQLVLAKSRVAPVKPVSIPRLELIAALMSTRLYVQVQEALKLDCDTYFWSDSAVVITWIVDDGDWNVFVRNRVKEIRQYTKRDDWRHISGTLNPADLPSRGCCPKKLIEDRWWEGPSWLRLNEYEWPLIAEAKVNEEEVNQERMRKTIVHNLNTVEESILYRLKNIEKYSKIIRVIAWMVRFAYRDNKTNKTLVLEIEEITKAEEILFRIIQKESFESNINQRGMKNLETIIDNGIIRVKTRLTLGEESKDYKYPVLLPSKHPIIEKLVEEKHKILKHAGVGIVVANLRETLWILSVKRLVRKTISKCIKCKRHVVKNYQTPCPPLPLNRIRKDASVFQVTGIDAAGPLILNDGSKCWILLFTCAIYRAVHLELITSMSTDCFIMALRKFIARRGRCETIYSDNGSNFVGTENQLATVNWEKIHEFSTIQRIKWIFNPPSAAWWGGWWERIIQMIKNLLKRTLGRASLSFNELETLLYEIEAVINSRPLTYIEERDTMRPLTPFSFLHDLPGSETPDLDAIDARHLRLRVRYIQTLRQNLRQRFRNEYLSLLVCHNKRTTKEIKVGDVVLVETEAKRFNWPLGLVIQIYPGKDDNVRVAKVKLADGFRIRPVQRLYPLEVEDPNEDAVVRSTKIAVESMNEEPRRSKIGRVIKPPRRLDL